MDGDDLRGRFRSPRRDYVGSMPARPADRQQPAPQSQPTPPPPVNRTPAQIPVPPKQMKPKKPRRKKGKLFVFLLVFLLALAGAGGVYYKFLRKKPVKSVAQSSDQAVQQIIDSQPTPAEKKTIRLTATGDMIPHGAILERAKQANGTYSFDSMFTNMKPYFEKSDINFCNQATPAGGASFGYTGYPVFNAPLEWPRALETAGCNLINIGSNHTNDKGQSLIDATVAAWDNRPNVLAVVGANRNAAEQSKIRYFEKNGVKFAIFSYSTYTNSPLTTPYGINMYNKDTAAAQIAEAKKNAADIIIVSMRWGTEYSPTINAEQDKIAQELADDGVDIVLGHGPHFMEPVKKLKGKTGNDTIVWFSLGNFLNAQIETESLIGGFAIMDIDTTTKKIADSKFMPVYVHYEWTAAEKAANSLLVRRNFSMLPLDIAANSMSKSQIGTTVEVQTDRVTKLLNSFTPVTIIKSMQF